MALPTDANVNHPRAWGYEASLDNRGGAATDKLYLRLADSPDRVSGIQTQEGRELLSFQENPEDVISSPGAPFSRSRFSGGEGLDRAHRRGGIPEFDATRYWDSRNLTIQPARAGEPEVLELAHETSELRLSNATNHYMARFGTVIYWAEDTDVLYSSDPTAASPTISSLDPEGAGGTPTTISGLVRLGEYLYVAIGSEGIHRLAQANSPEAALGNATYDETGGGVEDEWTLTNHGLAVGDRVAFTAVGTGATGYAANTEYWVVSVPDANTFTLSATEGGSAIEGTGDSSGTWTLSKYYWEHWSDLDCAGGQIWAVKGRIIAASGTTLYEAGSAATSVELATLPSGESWTDVVDVGTGIIAAATDGNLYIWSEESGALILRTQESFEGGEVPYSLGTTQGVLFIGTGEENSAGGKIGRLWIAEVIGLKVRNSQVIREWGSGTSPFDRVPRAFLGTRDSMYCIVVEDSSETYLWRFNVATTGLSRDLALAGTGIGQGLVVVDDRLFAGIQGFHIHREDTTYASSGYLISPLADFHTSDPKVWVGGRLDLETLAAGENAALYYTSDPEAILDPDSASWQLIRAFDSSTPQSVIDSEHPISGVSSRYLAAKVVLEPSADNTSTPTVYSFSLRALPFSKDVVVRLYVNVSDLVTMPFRHPVIVPRQGKRLWEELRDNWRGKNVQLHLFRPSLRVNGQVSSITTPIQGHLPNGTVQVFSVLEITGAVASTGSGGDVGFYEFSSAFSSAFDIS